MVFSLLELSGKQGAPLYQFDLIAPDTEASIATLRTRCWRREDIGSWTICEYVEHHSPLSNFPKCFVSAAFFV